MALIVSWINKCTLWKQEISFSCVKLLRFLEIFVAAAQLSLSWWIHHVVWLRVKHLYNQSIMFWWLILLTNILLSELKDLYRQLIYCFFSNLVSKSGNYLWFFNLDSHIDWLTKFYWHLKWRVKTLGNRDCSSLSVLWVVNRHFGLET